MTALAAEQFDVVEESQLTVEQAAVQDDSEVSGSQAAYERQIVRAPAQPGGEGQHYRGGLALGRFNVRVGLKNLAGFEPQYAIAGISYAALTQTLDVVDALGFALSRKRLVVKPPSDLPAVKSRVFQARRVMLLSAEAVARADDDRELLAQVERIGKGSGFLDAGEDVKDLAQLFLGKPAQFEGRSPVTRAMALQADEDGRLLQSLVTPKSASKPAAPAPTVEEQEIDRLWALLVQEHQQMRRAGYLVWGDGFNAFVPPLLSREAPRRTPPVPAPAQG